MNDHRPCLLIVDDEAAHVEAIRRAYEDAGVDAEIRSVGTLREFRASIRERQPDLALIDLNLPDGRAVEALAHPPEDAPFPILVMTAFGNQQIVVDVMKAGALDYVVKSPATFASMPRTVEHALHEWELLQKHKQIEAALRESEEKFRAIANYTVDWESWFGVDGKYLWVNPSVERFTGYSAEEVLAMPDFIPILIAEEDRAVFAQRFQEALRGVQVEDFEFRYLHKNGGKFWLSVSWRPIFDEHGNPLGVRVSGRDVTGRKRMDEYREMGRAVLQILNEPGNLQSSIQRILAEVKMRTGADAVGIRMQDGDDYPYSAQQGFSADFLQTENTLVARDADGGLCRDCDGRVKLEGACGLVISGKTDPANPFFTPGGSFWTNDSIPLLDLPLDRDPRFHPRDGCIHHGYASVALFPIRNKSRIVGLIHLNDRRKGFFTLEAVELLEGIASRVGEVLMHRRAEEAREQLQAQLNQAQRMESVGRLAGGVAHDFNNKLQVILGSVEMLLETLPPDDTSRPVLLEVQTAARRSADLTRQLLAFSRKQTISPVVLDLDEAVANSLKMLGRLIGENIRLNVAASTNLWPVLMDRGQLDQILANLAINARDAIPGSGTISIEVANRTLRDDDCRDRPDFVAPGDFVTLTFRDDGEGMPADILAHIFEPFFTTKDVGKGTGLGLATVYGIVKQNGGAIFAESEPGRGTTFTLHLPRSQADVHTSGEEPATRIPVGTETILLAEDETGVLDLVRRTLTQQGYTVLAASSPRLALKMCEAHAEPIHLLLTDVIMPVMNGKALADRVRELRPGIRVLFMSGYTAETMRHTVRLPEDLHVLQKPFRRADLAQRVRDALDSPPAPRPTA